MSSDIQFGDLEESEPQRALRPDQDGHFVVAQIGDVSEDELQIFVDLDVMRDMEAHARSNTRVELGGVMLGYQSVDDQGRPFVVITDCLRALHYEATKGSFKFTHDTWSQITRERDEFKPELEMVGWYHTHPGWSVFLSGMDLFICNNFFNRPLDVALVIDPCADDRGWFQWTTGANPKTQRTGGFHLTTGRYRLQELDHFARIYNKEPIMTQDPRYAGDTYGGGMQPMVNVHDNRKPMFEVAMMAMLLTQFLFFAIVAWKLLSVPASGGDQGTGGQVALLEDQMAQLESTRLRQAKDAAYQEVLGSIVAGQTGQNNLVADFTELSSSHQKLQSNIEAQMALSEKLANENSAKERELTSQLETSQSLSSQLVTARQRIEENETLILELEATQREMADKSDGQVVVDDASANSNWLWWVLGGLAVALSGGGIGFFLGKQEQGIASVQPTQNDFDSFNTDSDADANPAVNNDLEGVGGDVTVKIVDGGFEDPVNESEAVNKPSSK
jgi:proteasome lid subunit RPN8/RPN11